MENKAANKRYNRRGRILNKVKRCQQLLDKIMNQLQISY